MFTPRVFSILKIRLAIVLYIALHARMQGRIRSMTSPVHGNCHAQKTEREGDQPGRLTACKVFSIQYTAGQKNGQPLNRKHITCSQHAVGLLSQASEQNHSELALCEALYLAQRPLRPRILTLFKLMYGTTFKRIRGQGIFH